MQLLPPLCWQTPENLLSSAKMKIGFQQKSHVTRIFWCGQGLEGSQDRSCENKISIYAAFEGKGEGGNLATKWPQDVLQDQ